MKIFMSNKLTVIRKKQFLSQNDLAKISGVSKRFITKYENREKDINKATGRTLLKIATALNCKIEDLLENKDEIIKDNLYRQYCKWVDQIENENIHQELCGDSEPDYISVDCKKLSARKDFSNFANLKEEISFKEMLELQKIWEKQYT